MLGSMTLMGPKEVLGKLACANCQDKKDMVIVPYTKSLGGMVLAVIVLCGLCKRALDNNELGAWLDVRVSYQGPPPTDLGPPPTDLGPPPTDLGPPSTK